MTKTVFPYDRRTNVIREIADTFVEHGFDAGNALAFRLGDRMVGELIEADTPRPEIEASVRRFIRAWQAAAIPRLIDQHRKGGAA